MKNIENNAPKLPLKNRLHLWWLLKVKMKFLKQLRCRHEWWYNYPIKRYKDVFGHHVVLWRGYCERCGKLRKKIFFDKY